VGQPGRRGARLDGGGELVEALVDIGQESASSVGAGVFLGRAVGLSEDSAGAVDVLGIEEGGQPLVAMATTRSSRM